MGPLRTFTAWLRAGFTPAPPPDTPSADQSTPGKPRLVGTATTIKGPDGTLIHCRGMPELVYPGETGRLQAPAAQPAPEVPPIPEFLRKDRQPQATHTRPAQPKAQERATRCAST